MPPAVPQSLSHPLDLLLQQLEAEASHHPVQLQLLTHATVSIAVGLEGLLHFGLQILLYRPDIVTLLI